MLTYLPASIKLQLEPDSTDTDSIFLMHLIEENHNSIKFSIMFYNITAIYGHISIYFIYQHFLYLLVLKFHSGGCWYLTKSVVQFTLNIRASFISTGFISYTSMVPMHCVTDYWGKVKQTYLGYILYAEGTCITERSPKLLSYTVIVELLSLKTERFKKNLFNWKLTKNGPRISARNRFSLSPFLSIPVPD